MNFKYDIFIPFHLVDGAGILFFGHAFTLAHQAYEQFVCHGLELSWDFWFQNPEWILPIKHVDADYFHPLVAGHQCQIHLHIEEIRSSAFAIRYQISQHQIPCASIKSVHVFCQRETKHKQSIPTAIQKRLELYLV